MNALLHANAVVPPWRRLAAHFLIRGLDSSRIDLDRALPHLNLDLGLADGAFLREPLVEDNVRQ